MAVAAPFSLHCLAQEWSEERDRELGEEEEIEEQMLDRTKEALMSYEVVEERTEAILNEIRHSAFGEYAEKMAVLMPFVTGKIEFKVDELAFSYNHFSEKANLDYALDKNWKLFLKRKQDSEGVDESSGVKYSYRF